MKRASEAEYGHMPQLDGLRALAVAGVLLHHTSGIHAYAAGLAGRGGVWLFFCLSGFLITGILIRARDHAEAVCYPKSLVWRSFWVRRALRIFPLYYAAVILVAVLNLDGARSFTPWLATFAANIGFVRMGYFYHWVGHFWSLCVEEQFYLLWPVVCLWLPRRWLLPFALVGVAIAPTWRYGVTKAGCAVAARFAATPACLDGLGLGAVLAITGRTPPGAVALVGLLLSTYGAVAQLMGVFHSTSYAAEMMGYSLASWWVVGRAATGFGGRFGRILESPPLRYVGRISYGIYVIHNLVPAICEWVGSHWGTRLGLPPEFGPARLVYVTVISLALASLSWRFFERPLNDFKRHFPYVPRRR